MTYLASDTSWHSTDGAENVSVRSSASSTPAVQFSDDPKIPKRTAYVRIEPPRSSAGLAAVTGISIFMVLGTVFYLGIDNLRSSLLNQTKNITITAQGTFEPQAISIARGETLTITNANSDPQVLKAKTDELFPSTMLFNDQQPMTFTVPTTAMAQQYVYYSETLQPDKILTITVTSDAAAGTTSLSSSVQNDIPIPSDVQNLRSISQTSQSSPDRQTSPAVTMSTGTAPVQSATAPTATNLSAPTFSIADMHPAASDSSTASEVYIPVNPYTVGRQGMLNVGIASSAASKSTLHSGAPLNQYATARSTVSSGPEVIWTIVTALTIFVVVSRKMFQIA